MESDVKEKTLASADRTLQHHTCTESPDTESDEDERERSVSDIITVHDESTASERQQRFDLLSIPPNPKTLAQRSRQVSMERLQTVGQGPVVAAIRTTDVDPGLLVRRRGETAEEKQRRKLAVKQHRQERRKIRKTNQANFRAEHERQMKTQLKTLTIS
ncbi:unnamed protein product [Echinostoma caproni]|uniref:Protein LTV1 homolog n=1 Tax=Echinostoma caproni TaxID=27848 RepID=A0A3P8AXV6_9TREM|nr:unnamed protein product [Echinostoma caproni]